VPDAKPLLHSSELGRVTISLEAVACEKLMRLAAIEVHIEDVRRSA